MKNFYSIVFLLGCTLQAAAQDTLATDTLALQTIPGQQDIATSESSDGFQFRDSVWEEATANESINFRVFGRYARDDVHYRQLAERFEQTDTTLLFSDFLVLYYGYAYRDEYDGGYGRNSWSDFMKKEAYAEARVQIDSALKKAPATPYILADALWVAQKLNRPEQEIYSLQWRLFKLLACVDLLGNGTSEHPYSIINVSDEYTFMYNFLGIEQITGQTLVTNASGTRCDQIQIVPVDNNYFKGSEVWFDVTFPIVMLLSPHHWANKLTSKENEEN